MSSISPLPSLRFDQLLDDREDVFLAQRRDGVLGVEAEAHVELDAADGRQVVALGIEEQAVEQRFGGLARRRLAGAHDAVDVGQRLSRSSLLSAFSVLRIHGPVLT